ncbi:MAG: xanthine dehydrogenase family protein molybdopterin-binding subunit [Acidobacteria bacterium]|nr:xanthine dehydrogenase family protein molybdopterin-binding subunit [Acidobacteriota bacterium]MBI3657360.1 xanthine dehydrogenase family protein molybdopterin-binding subunit [Acidobacteriota bacterium]
MAEYYWPDAGNRRLIGQRISRVDGPLKVSGSAKYSADISRPGMLYGKVLRSPYAHAKIVSIDTGAAEKMPGVKAIHIIQGPGKVVQWSGAEILAVAAVDESTAEDALRKIKVKFEPLPFLVDEANLSRAGNRAKPAADQVVGDPDKAFQEKDVVILEGSYGLPVIAHCCLEPHGQVVEWEGDQSLKVYPSTQSVSGVGGEYAAALGIPAGNVLVSMQHIGGGFGSKFDAGPWGLESARLAKKAGRPVKYFLERAAEMTVAGNRPSTFAKIKLAAKPDGTLLGWESDSWGTGGIGGSGIPPIPYIFNIPNQRKRHTAVATNNGAQRAWRAPNHPQACFLTMSALDDMAAKLRMDPLEFFLKNIDLTGVRKELYRKELLKAAELMDWKREWHARDLKSTGPLKRGLGLSIHTWGGRAHNSKCALSIHPDGSVEVNSGSQDLGTGTRTVMAIVAAETFGLPVEAIKVNIGDSRFPPSGPSGGSTTVGGVTSATRRAAQDALAQLMAKVAPDLGVGPERLEAVAGRIAVKGDSTKGLSWKQACSKLGVKALTMNGENPGGGPLNNSGVGGVQMADVTVDSETGVVKINKLVAVQDCGLIIDLKTAESQVYGALIMGIGYALFEERIMDNLTGRMLNANLEFYKLAGLGDIGQLVVHMWMGDKEQDDRGVIGLGEPPVISPGAAISNAVANAIGVRVPNLPLTPDRVLSAMEKGGMAYARI